MQKQKVPQPPSGYYFPKDKEAIHKRDSKWIILAVIVDMIGLFVVIGLCVGFFFLAKEVGKDVLKEAQVITDSEQFQTVKEEMSKFAENPDAYREEMSKKAAELEKEYLDEAEKAIAAEKKRLEKEENAASEENTTQLEEETSSAKADSSL